MPAKNRMNFTKSDIDALALPEVGKRAWYWDTKIHGLALRVSAQGNKKFYVYRWVSGKPQQVSIGSFPDVSIEQARRKASELNGAAAQGVDLKKASGSTRGEMTFGKLFEWYFENFSKRKKSQQDDEMQYRLHFQKLVDRKISTITKQDLRALHEAIMTRIRRVDPETGTILRSGHYAANKALRLIRAIYNAAIREDVFKGQNPALSIRWYKEESRERRLMLSEIHAFYKAVDAEPNEVVRDFVYMSFYTAARKSNVLRMRWQDIDLGSRVWRIPETKNGKPQEIPLEDPEIEILKRRKTSATGPWVFPGEGKDGHMQDPRKGWLRILSRCGLHDLRLHDLRRSHASLMADTGATTAMIGKALNHLSPASTAVYERLAKEPLREAKRKALSLFNEAAGVGPKVEREPARKRAARLVSRHKQRRRQYAHL